MVLEAVWFKDNKEVFRISPVMNIVCYENMKNINEIEICSEDTWYSCKETGFEADDFAIRIKKD